MKTSSNSKTDMPPVSISEIQGLIPFETKEPETLQAEIVITIEGEEERTFIARSHGKIFTKRNEIGSLQKSDGNTFSINFEKKIYFEATGKPNEASKADEESLNDFLTTEWLNQKSDVKFENLGIENGRAKYRVAFDASESIIFVDENYKIPVRQEFYSVDGDSKNLVYSMELQNIKLIADEQFFEIPKDFRKVSADEFRQAAKR